MKYWKIYCMENRWPGLWRKYFQSQAVAIGFPPKTGNIGYGDAVWHYTGKSRYKNWSQIRNCLKKIHLGDKIVVQLENHGVGRIGEVVGLAVSDKEWDPFIKNKLLPVGEMGRRINVRWDLSVMPLDPDVVARLPEEASVVSRK